MKRIPNTASIGDDNCLSSILIEVPVIIIDNGTNYLWFHQAMKASSAERITFALNYGCNVEAYQTNVKLILPSASEVRAVTTKLAHLQSEPVRINLFVD